MSLTGTLEQLAESLSANQNIGRPVLDKTGLQASYLLVLQVHRDEDLIHVLEAVSGLKVESQKATLDTVVVDHIQPPSGN